ncbi:hypothetical protein CRYUN_Cryun01aG0240900 [Craigia yunnanensis]
MEPAPYNNVIRYLYQYCQKKGISSFPQLLASMELTLISKSEAADSSVLTDDDARSFFSNTKAKTQGLESFLYFNSL